MWFSETMNDATINLFLKNQGLEKATFKYQIKYQISLVKFQIKTK